MTARRLEDIFAEALARSPEERGAYLDAACGADSRMRDEVDSLLAAHDEAGVFMGEPSVGESGLSGAFAELDATAGTMVGPYELLEQIGEGGFGTVFLAQQRTPVQRQVAVKIIKLGMDTKQVIARFEAERQALAMMDHPDIARVLDAGSTATGRPYFVMELVAGAPITKYCDRVELSIRGRLELFERVCKAVQHAHNKGIIHRDIKPSNVLVVETDGRPAPKIIDFGIAKATGHDGRILTDRTLCTARGQFVGTPEYMSPEQAGRGAEDVDTRADVYALGALLYELLSGAPPFDSTRLRAASLEEMGRIIREDDPITPSTRLQSGDASEVAARRRVDPARLGLLLRGELDWVVMRCLEKDRARRYETADALALEVRRFLEHEPVLACPPSRIYRLRKLVRRHRGMVVATSLVAAALLLGAGAALWQAVRANDAAARAAEQSLLANRRADETRKVADFQAGMLGRIDATAVGAGLMADLRTRFEADIEKDGAVAPAEREARIAGFRAALTRINATGTAAAIIERTILQPAVAAIERDFEDQPAVAATLRRRVADLYNRIGRYAQARDLLVQALTTQTAVLGPEHPDTLDASCGLGLVLLRLGRLEEADPHILGTHARCRDALGPHDPQTLEAKTLVGYLRHEQGRVEEALASHRETLLACRAALGDRHWLTLTAQNNVAVVLWSFGRLEAAETCLREVLGTDHEILVEDPAITMINLSAVLRARGQPGEALRLSEAALALSRRENGDAHPTTLRARIEVGGAHADRGGFALAEPHLREALAALRHALGDAHMATVLAQTNLGTLMCRTGHYEEAERLARAALATVESLKGGAHVDTVGALDLLGTVLLVRGRLGAAEPFLRRAIEIGRRTRDAAHPDTIMTCVRLGWLLAIRARHADAERILRDALAGSAGLGDGHPVRLHAIAYLGKGLAEQGRYVQAKEHLQRAYEGSRAALGAEHPSTLEWQVTLGDVQTVRREFDAARQLLDPGLQTCRRVLGDRHPTTLLALTAAARLLQDTGQLDAAETAHREAVRLARAVLGEDHFNTIIAIGNLATILRKRKQLEEAVRLREEALERSRRVLGEDDPVTLVEKLNYGVLCWGLGKRAASISWLEEACAGLSKVEGERHPDTIRAFSQLGTFLLETGSFAQAEPRLQKAVELGREVLGPTHRETLIAIQRLGSLFLQRRELAKAAPLLREAAQETPAAFGPDHRQTVVAIGDWGSLLSQQGDLAKAEPYLREAADKAAAVFGPRHTRTLLELGNVGALLMRKGEVGDEQALAEAEPYLRRSLAGNLEALGPQHVNTRIARANLGFLLLRRGELVEAEQVLTRSLADHMESVGPRHAHTFAVRQRLIDALERRGRLEEVERVLESALEALGPRGEAHPHVLWTMHKLGTVLAARRRFAEAETVLLRANTAASPQGAASPSARRELWRALAALYTAWHRAEPGAGHDAQAAHWRKQDESGSSPVRR